MGLQMILTLTAIGRMPKPEHNLLNILLSRPELLSHQHLYSKQMHSPKPNPNHSNDQHQVYLPSLKPRHCRTNPKFQLPNP